MNTLQNISRLVGKTFTLWAILFSALGLFAPDLFKWVLPMGRICWA